MTTDKLVNNVQAPTYSCVVFWHHCSKALVAVCSFGSATETWLLEDFVQAIKHVHWVVQKLLATDYIWKVVEATKVWGYILKPMEDTNVYFKITRYMWQQYTTIILLVAEGLYVTEMNSMTYIVFRAYFSSSWESASSGCLLDVCG